MEPGARQTARFCVATVPSIATMARSGAPNAGQSAARRHIDDPGCGAEPPGSAHGLGILLCRQRNQVGAGVSEFHPGDRVACAGGGYAVHAEAVCVPKNLVVRLAENVDYGAAAFTTLGSN